MASPEEQLMLRNGSKKLSKIAQVNKFRINQKVDVNEAAIQQICPCVENENKYNILLDNNDTPTMVAIEKSNLCCRWCCSPCHPASIVFYEYKNKEILGVQVFKAEKPFRLFQCINLFFCCAAQINTYVDNEKVGTSNERACTCFTPRVDVTSEDKGWYGEVSGPSCCLGAIWTDKSNRIPFRLKSQANSDNVSATIISGDDKDDVVKDFVTDSDNYDIILQPEYPLNIKEKAHLLSTVILLDYLFYEDDATNLSQGCYLGSLYCNGCIIPCRCEFNSNN